MNAPYAAFCCRDGYFALAAGTNKLWEAACEVISRSDLPKDPRFATPTLRAKHQDALREVLEAEFVKYDANDLLAHMNARGVPCAPLYNYSQVLADPQVKHMEWVQDLTLPNGVASKTVISPQRVSGQRLDVRKGPPALGAHTAEILAELNDINVKDMNAGTST